MENMKGIVNFNTIIAESINIEKQDAVIELENKLNTCSGQWQQHTRKFIEIIKGNVSERDKLVVELRSLVHDYIYKDKNILEVKVEDIISRLQDLDEKDVAVADFYKAVMNKEII